MNSKQKGNRGEREFAAVLRDVGFEYAKRGCQFQGGQDSPDVIGVKGIHFEVKREERGYKALDSAMEQATNDSGNNIPVVAHRRNRGDWLITIRAKDISEFIEKWQT